MTLKTEEVPVVFDCQGEQLIGIIHRPVEGLAKTGVLLIVGGPQYRVGSHRQFILLARMLADKGIAVMRFDYRGMGDSSGDRRSFDSVDDDVHAAMDTFFLRCTGLEEIVLWGLCDAACAALFYANRDQRVNGLVLLNPWVFTEQGSAKTYLKHYYWQRLSSPDLWRKILTLRFDYRSSLFSLLNLFSRVLKPHSNTQKVPKETGTLVDKNLPLPDRMRECLQRFEAPVLLILSGRDLTADEFRGVVKSDSVWRDLLNRAQITRLDLSEADHTFSTQKWRDEVAKATLTWVKELM